MTDSDDVAGRVRKIINDHLDAPNIDDVTDDKGIIDDLGADSLDQVELVMAIEEEFGIEVPDDEFEAAITVGDVIKLVHGRIAA